MGLERKKSRKPVKSFDIQHRRRTNLSLVFDVFKDHLKTSSPESIDSHIVRFFESFCSLRLLNQNLASYQYRELFLKTSESTHQRYLLRVLFLKAVLPLDILRSLHLFPPQGVDFNQWVCLASPCSSSDRYKCQDAIVLRDIRKILNNSDLLPEGFYESFNSTWGHFKRLNAVNQERKIPVSNNSPLMLFPVKHLPSIAKAAIITLYGKTDDDFVSILDQLFLCPDHFGAAKGISLELGLRSDALFNFSLEYLYDVLNNGHAVIRAGRKSWKNLEFLPTLVSLLKHKPAFVTPNPVNENTLAQVKSLLLGVAGSSSNLDTMFSRQSSAPTSYTPG